MAKTREANRITKWLPQYEIIWLRAEQQRLMQKGMSANIQYQQEEDSKVKQYALFVVSSK